MGFGAEPPLIKKGPGPVEEPGPDKLVLRRWRWVIPVRGALLHHLCAGGPYEDATSAEPLVKSSTGSPPSRAHHTVASPNPPGLGAAQCLSETAALRRNNQPSSSGMRSRMSTAARSAVRDLPRRPDRSSPAPRQRPDVSMRHRRQRPSRRSEEGFNHHDIVLAMVPTVRPTALDGCGAAYNGRVVIRDERGVEYDPVPLPTHEVTDAVAVDARRVNRSAPRKSIPLYAGTDGLELSQQPRGHRRHWTDLQWLAFEEYRRLEQDLSADDEPLAAVMIVRPHDPAPR